MEDNQECIKCHIEQPINDFYKRKVFSLKEQKIKVRIETRCKKCIIVKSLKYQKDNKIKVNMKNRRYVNNLNNGMVVQEKTDELIKHRALKEKIRKKEINKQYYIDNKDKITEQSKIYRDNNKDKVNKRILKYINNRYRKDINFKLVVLLRSRLLCALKTKAKKGSAVRDLGCSIEFLKQHLESQFQEGMTWDNQGKWHIDHIIPISRFNLTNREELLKACHYTNLQPLWANDNRRKSNKWNKM